MFELHEITDNKEKAVITRQILYNLPNWFQDKQAIEDYAKSAAKNFFYVVNNHAKIPVGFLNLKILNLFSAEVEVMGVNKNYHRKGIGTLLIKKAIHYLQCNDYKYLAVRTLSESSYDLWYKDTRNFYFAQGFYPLNEMEDMWGKENPCVIMVRSL